MSTQHLRITALAAVAALGLATAPAMSAAAAGHHPPHSVRSFDSSLLDQANLARSSVGRSHYTMNHKLWKVAHKWAEHLAATGTLAHDPKLTKNVTKACPQWTDTGENVGMVYGETADQLFQAYMADPPHRANILNKSYRQVGIATVKVERNGESQEWDVMDFANHCH
jgi:uncharacterized protein YkwD